MDGVLSIGEFSERCGLSPKMLRTYAAVGLLLPVAVDRGTGYRYYSPGQIHEGKVIAALRRAAVAVAEVARFVQSPDAAQLDAWAHELDDELRTRHRALAEARELLALEAVPPAAHHERRHVGGVVSTELIASATTDVGRMRTTNEDAVLADRHVVAVADGLGGHAAGEIASRTAIDALRAAFIDTASLLDACLAANRAVWERARDDDGLDGMGTTLCAATLLDQDGDTQIAVVNVGDSRAYLLRDGQLSQLTEDHNVVADLVRRGEVAANEARSHPHRGMLTRALGMGPDVEADSVFLPGRAGDRLLLCTDGLVDELEDRAIRVILQSVPGVEAAATELVAQALAAGGRDNVSVVVVDIA